jgi:hypothetical protein
VEKAPERLSRDRRTVLPTCPKCGCRWSSRNVYQRRYPEIIDYCPGDYYEATHRIRNRAKPNHPRGASAVTSSTFKAPPRQRAPWLVRFPDLYSGERVKVANTHWAPKVRRPGYPLATEYPV